MAQKTEKMGKDYGPLTKEEIIFFNKLVQKLADEYKEYKFDQNIEHIIIKRTGREIYIPKSEVIPLENDPKGINIKDYIKQILDKDRENN